MQGIIWMDGVVRTVGWNAVYQKNIDLGIEHVEAVREAQNATLRTQPAAHAKDIANLYASSEYLNWFTMFTNQLNQIYNIVTYDTFASWNNKQYQEAAMRMLAVSINAVMIWTIANQKAPDDEDDLIDAFTDAFLNMVPLLGRSMAAAKDGFGPTTLPAFQAASDIIRVFSVKEKDRAAQKAVKSLAALIGVPVVLLSRTAKFLETGDPAELLGKKKKKKSKGITI